MVKKAIFLDRDGTINSDSEHYIKNLQEFQIFPFAFEALRIFQNMGYELIVITNQSGVGRGFLSEKKLKDIHLYLREAMQEKGVVFSNIYYCPHLPEENCSCRKPKSGNLKKAIAEHHLNAANSWFIGDSKKDIITGSRENCKTLLVLSGIKGITNESIKSWEIRPDIVAADLLDAAKIIRNLESGE